MNLTEAIPLAFLITGLIAFVWYTPEKESKNE